jgi:hypothetical protein
VVQRTDIEGLGPERLKPLIAIQSMDNRNALAAQFLLNQSRQTRVVIDVE